MADCPLPFHRARQWRGAPMCGQLQVGRRLVGVVGDGGCPLNLLIALWQSTSGRYHTLCWPPAQRILWVALQRWAVLTDTQETHTDEGHHMVFEESELSATECSPWQVWTDDFVATHTVRTYQWRGFRCEKYFTHLLDKPKSWKDLYKEVLKGRRMLSHLNVWTNEHFFWSV